MQLLARPSTLGRTAAAIALATLACTAGAQVYRIVGPDGKVTFADKPPAADTAAKVAPAGVGHAERPVAANSALPFELRQVASRYPVTFYSGPDCGPCGSGRAFLSSRGVPFTEKTVSTTDDLSALQRLSGGVSLPFLTIGGQQLTGYSETEWSQFLDAAGYPRSSRLPASYRNPAASPLVAAATASRAAPAAPAPAPARTAAPAAAPAPSGSNPAGIQF